MSRLDSVSRLSGSYLKLSMSVGSVFWSVRSMSLPPDLLRKMGAGPIGSAATAMSGLSCPTEHGPDRLLVLRQFRKLADRDRLHRRPQPVVSGRARRPSVGVGQRFGHREAAEATLAGPHSGAQEDLELIGARTALVRGSANG